MNKLIKRIKNILVGDKQPKDKYSLWLDTSEGEANAVLKYKGHPIAGGRGSSTNPGYNITKQTVTLFNDTIETRESSGIYQGGVENIDFDLIAGENYTVVFDGTSYDVEAITAPFGDGFVILGELNDGDPSFETYPFDIMLFTEKGVKGLWFATNTEGSHTVEIKHEEGTVTTTPEFKDAVDSVTGYSIDTSNEILFDGTVETVDDGGYNVGIITPTITFVLGDTYKVTFNGIEYTCNCFGYEIEAEAAIGAPYIDDIGLDWSTYPFNIETFNTGGGQYETDLTTSQEGSYTLKIEHLTTSTKTTSAFESMIQGIVSSGSDSGDSVSDCKVIYPDYIMWLDGLYSQYNNAPEAGNIYFIPFADNDSPYRGYLYPVHIDELTNDNNVFSGSATIIGNPIIMYNGTLTAQPFDGVINPDNYYTSGLSITYSYNDNVYRLSYQAGGVA